MARRPMSAEHVVMVGMFGVAIQLTGSGLALTVLESESRRWWRWPLSLAGWGLAGVGCGLWLGAVFGW